MVVLEENVRVVFLPWSLKYWSDEGLETVTQSGSGLSVKGLEGLWLFRIEFLLGG